MKEKKDYLIPLAALACLFLAVAGLTWKYRAPAPEYLQGEVEATQVDLASKITGRVKKILIREGDWVEKGSLTLELSSPEIEAKLNQAAAAEEAGPGSEKQGRGRREAGRDTSGP